MAFNLILKSGEQFEWHIGSKKPMFKPHDASFKNNPKPFDNVIFLQADGDELELVRSHIHNIPIRFLITTWRNDLAQLIYDNITT